MMKFQIFLDLKKKENNNNIITKKSSDIDNN